MNRTVNIITWALLACVGAAAMSACSRAKVSPISVSDLMADSVDLENVLMRCNQKPKQMQADAECRNARIAIGRLDAIRGVAEATKRQADFERMREQRRAEQERLKLQKEAASKVDPYTMPLAPEAPPTANLSGAN
jgi:hypothetical protein